MTIDPERYDSIKYVGKYLDLLLRTPAGNWSSPTQIKKEIRALLRHYPEDWWLESKRQCPRGGP